MRAHEHTCAVGSSDGRTALLDRVAPNEGARRITGAVRRRAALLRKDSYLYPLWYILGAVSIRTTTPSPRRWQSLLSVLCMALIFLSGTIAVTHSHDHGIDDHGACSLCVTAHAVAQVASAPGQVTLLQVFQDLIASAPVARPRTFVHADHYTRPPPVSAYCA